MCNTERRSLFRPFMLEKMSLPALNTCAKMMGETKFDFDIRVVV